MVKTEDFLRADIYAECKVIITGKEVNLAHREGMKVPCLKDFWNNNINRLIDIERLYLFFQLFNQQSDALNYVTPNAFANSRVFSVIMIPSIGIFWLLFLTNQLYIALPNFS